MTTSKQFDVCIFMSFCSLNFFYWFFTLLGLECCPEFNTLEITNLNETISLLCTYSFTSIFALKIWDMFYFTYCVCVLYISQLLFDIPWVWIRNIFYSLFFLSFFVVGDCPYSSIYVLKNFFIAYIKNVLSVLFVLPFEGSPLRWFSKTSSPEARDH